MKRERRQGKERIEKSQALNLTVSFSKLVKRVMVSGTTPLNILSLKDSTRKGSMYPCRSRKERKH